MAIKIEFRPEHNRGRFLSRDGKTIDLNALPLSQGLRERRTTENDQYEDDKLRIDCSRNQSWLLAGRAAPARRAARTRRL